jgi:hypothetical protein
LRSPPEVSEPIGRHLGVANRVLDILVSEVVLQSARVVAIVGELEATRMSKHVWMDGKRHLGGLLPKNLVTGAAKARIVSRPTRTGPGPSGK